MMKYILLLILSYSYLLSAGFWTLTGVTKANIYTENNIAYLKPQTISKAKEKMTKTLESSGIKTKEQDSPTLMLSLEEIENDDEHYVYLKLALGEEVTTFREDKSAAFVISYLGTDFFETETEELDDAILESLDFLLTQFIEQFEDDKE